jgi:hypothetical protein
VTAQKKDTIGPEVDLENQYNSNSKQQQHVW